MGRFRRLRRGPRRKQKSIAHTSQSPLWKKLHLERLEQRRLLAADIDLADLLPANGGDGSVGFIINGIDASDVSGTSVSTAGDINGDGLDDLVIGARDADPNGNSSAGESYVVFGQMGGFAATLNLSTLNGANGFVINGIDVSDRSGVSVSSAGDINDDGIDDLLIAAVNADPNGNSSAGESYVVYGSLGGFAASLDLSTLNGSNGFTINGIDIDDASGRSVSSAGDFNGDGIGDIVIGALNGDPNGNASAGESYVVFGQAGGFGASLELSALNGANGFVINGIDPFDVSGISVDTAGDVNGDGFDDLILGAHEADPNGNGYAGESYVVFGQAAGFGASLNLSALNGANGFIINGIDASDFSGRSVGTAGDFNGDGFDDLAIGAPSADPNGNNGAGESYVVFGQAGGFGSFLDMSSLNGTNGFTINGIDSGDLSGRSVSAAGDVNGDGFDDLLVGAHQADPNGNSSAGESYVVFGQAGGFGNTLDLSTLNGTNGFVINGIDVSDQSGYSVDAAGDINGDGFDDLVIGAWLADPNGNNSAGETYVIFGGDLTSSVTQNGTTGADILTGSAAVDILVGGQDDDTLVGNGGADVLRGGEGDDILAVGDLTFSRIVGGSGTDTLRLDTSGATLDLTTLADNRILDVEQIDVTGLSPNTLTLDVQEVLNLSSHSNTLVVMGDSDDTVNAGAGWMTTAIETIGIDDYVVLTQGNATLKVDTDIALNRSDLLIDLSSLVPANGGDGSVGFTLYGIDADDASGAVVSDVGDVNGDGFSDIVISAVFGDGLGNTESNAGESYIVFGRADFTTTPTFDLSLLDGTNGFTVYGVDPDDRSGLVSAAGDVNGDGFADVLVGANRADGSGNSEVDAGETYVVFGKADFSTTPTIDLANLSGTDGFTLYGVDATDYSAISVSGAGDVNGDGFDDLVVGAPRGDNAGPDAGESYLVFGKADFSGTPTIDLATLNGTNGFTLYGVEADDWSGFFVDTAGDVNADGFDDLLIGAIFADGATNTDIDAGESYVVFGKADFSSTPSINLGTLNGTDGFTLFGVDADDNSSRSLSTAGDVNGDGFDDLLIGARGADGLGNLVPDAGESYVVYGKSDFSATPTIHLNSLDGCNGFSLIGIDSADRSGRWLSTAGDVNGDGFDDLVIGAYIADGVDNLTASAGETYIVFGKADLCGTPSIDLSSLGAGDGFTLIGIDGNDISGTSVSAAGDINGDGFDDIIIGASRGDGETGLVINTGETYVIFGGDFSASVTQNGTSTADTLTGTGAVDVLIGGLDDDELIGAGGADVLRGGEGNDILAVSDLTFSRIVGGTGTDTLRLDATGLTLDLTSMPDNRIVDVEQIDITGLSPNTLTLNAREVLNLSSNSNTLVVLGDGDDTVNAGGGWTSTGTEMIGSDLFNVYAAGNATLKVDADIALQITGLVVDTTSDVVNGDYSSGDFTLREAVYLANSTAGAQTITFDVALSGRTIGLGGTELELMEAVSIDATSLPAGLTINADQDSRIFHITTSTGDFTIAGLTLTGGKLTGNNQRGGAIRSVTAGLLTIDQATIIGNETDGERGDGGGVWALGDVTLTQSEVLNNSTNLTTLDDFGYGGGMLVVGNLTVIESTIDGNSTNGPSAAGGGILVSGVLTIENSTVSNNQTTASNAEGGGIYANGNVIVVNSTISGNSTLGAGSADGGGIYAKGTISISNSTITNNQAIDPTSTGGGIWNDNDAIDIDNSIIAGNTAGGGNPDIDPGTGALTVDYSLIGDTSGTGITGSTGTGNILNQSAQLDPLADNGGPTKTHALQATSPAIDAGDPGIVFDPAEFDQRGAPLARVFDDPVATGSAIDMGAYERQALAPAYFVVTTTADELDFSNSDVSLREAILAANGSIGADTISFASPLFDTPQTIDITSQLPTITDELTITGPGADLLTIDAGNGLDGISGTYDGYRIFEIRDDVQLSGIELTGGDVHVNGSGGAIYNEGNLTLFSSSITGNSGGGRGGGIYNSSVLTVIDSTISENSGSFGGGIHNYYGTVNITNTTISGNSASTGGGIGNLGTTNIARSTFSNNSASTGDAISNVIGIGQVTIDNSILGNFGAPLSGGGYSGEYNLLWSSTQLGFFTDSISGNPLLGPLQDNGGPTETHALLSGSPAINAGDPSILFNPTEFDQRGTGFERVLFDRIDIGAYEFDDVTIPPGGLVVDTAADIFDGDYSTGNLSLREAVYLANGNPGPQSITFDTALSGSTIALNGTDIDITDELTIDASSLVSPITIDADQDSRIFDIGTLSDNFDVTLAGLTLIDGRTTNGNDHGGAIRSLTAGHLTFTQSTVSGSSTTGVSARGGGIYARGGVTLDQSTVSGNSTTQPGASGGGVFAIGAVTLDQSTLSGNSTSGTSANGGGIFSSGPVTLIQSTVTENQTTFSGTIGGGIWNDNDPIVISSSILSANSSGGASPNLAPGSGTRTVNYSLIGGDIAPTSGGNNITSNTPMLDPLADNGGPTQTRAPQTGSQAINMGDPSIIDTTDQRGLPFARNDGNGIDIGAYEVQSLSLVVDTIDDVSDGDYSVLNLSLREAVELANANPGEDTITFAAALSGQTITLGGTDIEVTDEVVIDATALASPVTIDADQQSRIFNIDDPSTGSDNFNVTIAGLTLSGGSTTSFGGAIFSASSGTLTINQTTVSGNETTGNNARGGGIFANGSLILNQSEVTGNSTHGENAHGGGIRAISVMLTESSVNNNGAHGDNSNGGGIFAISSVTLMESTVRLNGTNYYGSGGGIHAGSTVTLTKSTVSENTTAPGSGGGGGILASGPVSLTESTVSGNVTLEQYASGAGIRSYSTVTLNQSTVSGNYTFGDNVEGAGISANGLVTLTQSTVTNNHAGGYYSYGGGVSNNNYPVEISGSILSDNSASNGGEQDLISSGSITVNHSLIGTGVTPTSGGNNISSDSPMLGLLQNSGGPTETHAPLFGSPAINGGDPAFTAPPDFDQRGTGFPRVQLGRIDIGAVEYQITPPPLGWVVSTTDDVVDGDLSAGELSLREAVMLANLNVGADTVLFDVSLAGQTITLGGTDIDITGEVEIDATALTGPVTIDASGQSRIFDIDDPSTGSETFSVKLAGLTLTGGRTTANSERGGAVRSATLGDLTIDQITIAGNGTTGDDSPGGGIWALGIVALSDSNVSGNDTLGTGSSGGGIFSQKDVTLVRSTVSGNSTAGPNSDGGGIYSADMVTVDQSTVSGNNTAGSSSDGGGIFSFAGVALTQSTISGNSTASFGSSGGGVNLGIGTLTVTNTTVTDNHAYDAGSTGGGIWWSNFSSINITSSIIAGNTAGGGTPDIGSGVGTLAVDFSLIGDTSGSGITGSTGTGNILNQSAKLGPLANNGGPTQTHALLPGSPAIDAGHPFPFPPIANDQRGAPFAREVDIAGGGARMDIGAFEIQSAPTSLVVDTSFDEHDGDFGPGDLSLREAVGWANNFLGANTITFDAGLSGQTIMLGGTDIDITDGAIIDATALASPVTIDANLLSRIFDIDDPSTTSENFDVTIAGLTLTGGRTTAGAEQGGAVRSATLGNLTIDQSTISGNSTAGINSDGGGVHANGSLTLIQSTVSGNSTAEFRAEGGGISATDATLIQSTVSGNSTSGFTADGGGIAAQGTVILNESVVSGNSTAADSATGGGIWSYGSVILDRSTVSGNSTAGADADGGGIFVEVDVTLTQSTVSGNSTTGTSAHGGGILSEGNITLTMSTITDNHAYDLGSVGGGIASTGSNPAIDISGTIIAGNTAGGGNPDLDPGTGMLSVDYSLIGDTSGTGITGSTGTGNILNQSALLDPLANNGGATQTHALQSGSLAIDAGDATAAPGVGDVPLFDQRGNNYGRVQNGRIDIGAFEVRETPSADFDSDGFITGLDFLRWQRGYGTAAPTAVKTDGDADNDLDVDSTDLNIWEQQYGMAAPLVAAVSSEQSEDEVTRSASLLVVEASTESLESLSMEAATKETADSASPAAIGRSDNDLLNTVRALQHRQRHIPKAHLQHVHEAAFAELFTEPPVLRDRNLPTVSHGHKYSADSASDRTEDSAQLTWLADELLERVFG